jgi:prophage antirepressor-like protein
METAVQEAIDKGLPKTKIAKIPFRMEMSAFARHEGSLPVIGDIGKIWPVMAHDICSALGIKLDFLSASQDTPEGQAMRDWIVDNVKPLNREKMISAVSVRH